MLSLTKKELGGICEYFEKFSGIFQQELGDYASYEYSKVLICLCLAMLKSKLKLGVYFNAFILSGVANVKK